MADLLADRQCEDAAHALTPEVGQTDTMSFSVMRSTPPTFGAGTVTTPAR